MRNYFKLYKTFTKVNVKGLMSYGLDMAIGSLGVLIENASNLFLILVLYTTVNEIGGWGFYEMLFLYGFSTLGYAIWHTFFINTISIAYYARRGRLDRFMITPVNVVFQIMTDSFDDDGLGDMLFALIVLGLALYNLNLSYLNILLAIVLALFSALVFAAVTLFTSSLSLVFMDNSVITKGVLSLKNFSKYPITIFPRYIQLILTFVIPLGLTGYHPVSLILNFETSINMIYIVLISLCSFILSCLFFNCCLRRYNSSGH